jgi:hypothetical protein
MGAQAAAERLASEYGYSPGLIADVQAALHTQGQQRRLDRYADPVALGSLVVSIATLAWTIYADLKKETTAPAPAVVARRVRVALSTRDDADAASPHQVVEVVVTEVINAAEQSGDGP